jgi:hypothetical protein
MAFAAHVQGPQAQAAHVKDPRIKAVRQDETDRSSLNSDRLAHEFLARLDHGS